MSCTVYDPYFADSLVDLTRRPVANWQFLMAGTGNQWKARNSLFGLLALNRGFDLDRSSDNGF